MSPEGTQLVLQNNGADDLVISNDGDFRFATELLDAGSDNSRAENWRASNAHGTPGALNSVVTAVAENPDVEIPLRFSLSQNYPNPFNPTTIIAYTLKEDAHVRLEIFDIQGHLVRVLEDKFQTAGSHNLIWDSRNTAGDPVASGIYFYRMTTPDFRFSRKMVLVR